MSTLALTDSSEVMMRESALDLGRHTLVAGIEKKRQGRYSLLSDPQKGLRMLIA